MAWFTRSSRFTILALALTLSPALNVSAQSPQSGSSSLGSQLQRAFRPPSRGLPDNRQGGATRGPGADSSCFTDKETRRLTALVPVGGGETAAESPTVFWYMPRMSDIENDQPGAAPAPEMEFKLSDAKGTEILHANYGLTKSANGDVGTPGIMSLTLPGAMQVGQEYKWQLRVTCDAKGSDRSNDQFAEGVLKRVAEDPNLSIRAQQASPEERILLYANANRWYDMLANLVALRRDRPNDPTVVDAWNKVFAVVNLNQVSIQSRSQGTSTTTNSN